MLGMLRGLWELFEETGEGKFLARIHGLARISPLDEDRTGQVFWGFLSSRLGKMF